MPDASLADSMRDTYGPYRINPAFDNFPEEGRLIGKLLAGFGEIEFSMCRNAGEATNLQQDVFKSLYRLRATSSRLEAADALARPRFFEIGLIKEYELAQSMVSTCLKLRNQFAHCNWQAADIPDGGLFFAALQASAEAIDGFELVWRHVDVPLLQSHELYFAMTMEWLWFIYHELRTTRGSMPPHAWPKPPTQERPRAHNPPEKHMPPWLDEDQKAQHLARAQAAQGGSPTPTPKQLALDKARAEKRARLQKNREASAKGSSPPESDG